MSNAENVIKDRLVRVIAMLLKKKNQIPFYP